MCKLAAKALDKAHMIRYDERQGYLYATDLGRTASHYYIKYDTVEVRVKPYHNVHCHSPSAQKGLQTYCAQFSAPDGSFQ